MRRDYGRTTRTAGSSWSRDSVVGASATTGTGSGSRSPARSWEHSCTRGGCFPSENACCVRNATTDAEIDAFIKANALVVNHVSGTAAMGKTGSTGKGSGVLNADLTVKGVVGLRVVDASAFVSCLHSAARC